MDLSMGPLLAFVICTVVAALVLTWLLLLGIVYLCAKYCEHRWPRGRRAKAVPSNPMSVQLLAAPDRALNAAAATEEAESTVDRAPSVETGGAHGGGARDFQYVAFRERPHFTEYGPLTADRWSVDYSSNRNSWYDRNSSFRRSEAESKRDELATWSYAELLRGAESESCREDEMTLTTSCNSSDRFDLADRLVSRGEHGAVMAAGDGGRVDAARPPSAAGSLQKTATIRKASSIRQSSLVAQLPSVDT